MSEIKRITGKAAERTKEGRENPAIRRDDKYVIDLIYLLEESTRIISHLCQSKSPLADDALTIGNLHNILDEIGDENLKAYFMNKISDGMKKPIREQTKIKDVVIE